MSASHGQAAPVSRLRGPLSGLPAEVKVVGLVALLLVVGVTPPSAPWALAAQGAIAIGLAVLALVDWRSVAARLTLDLPLAVLAVTYALAGRAPHTELLGITVSEPGLRAGLTILAKATIGILGVSALAASSSVSEILHGLQRVGAPRWFVHLVALTVRQLQVLRRDLARLRLAVAVRTGSEHRLAALAHGARSLGTLFVRSTERTDRLQLAAELRGASATGSTTVGVPATTDAAAVRPRHWMLAVVPAVLAAGAVVVSAA
jgi:cobalt/nickel transport system permease protein